MSICFSSWSVGGPLSVEVDGATPKRWPSKGPWHIKLHKSAPSALEVVETLAIV